MDVVSFWKLSFPDKLESHLKSLVDLFSIIGTLSYVFAQKVMRIMRPSKCRKQIKFYRHPPTLIESGVPISFPISWIPYLGYWWPLIDNYKKTPPFPGFLGKSIRDYGQKYPLSRENRNTHATPLCIRVGGGGGGVSTLNDNVWKM